MINYVILFVASFSLVGLLGLQSKNVQHSRYFMAAITSAAISVSNFVFVRIVTTGGYDNLLVTMVGGAAGIMVAIYLHDVHLSKIRKKGK